MSRPDRAPLELSEVFTLLVSSQAITRARFTVLIECIARILAHLEDRDEQALLAELRQRLEDEKKSESDYLKEYLRRLRHDAPSEDPSADRAE